MMADYVENLRAETIALQQRLSEVEAERDARTEECRDWTRRYVSMSDEMMRVKAERDDTIKDLRQSLATYADVCVAADIEIVSLKADQERMREALDKLLADEVERLLVQADEERNNPFERHAYMRARHTVQMLRDTVFAALSTPRQP